MQKQTRLGKTDIHICPIGLGTNAVGGHNLYPNLDEEQGKDLVRKALSAGINFLDTAFIYGPKRSEELIGQVLKERGDRDKVILATKGAHQFVDGSVVMNNSASFLRNAVEGSLARLQTDYIDLYYIHYPDESTPKDEAVGALQKLREEGKIRAIGVSNFSNQQVMEANADGYLDVVQGRYNLFQREAEENILPYTCKGSISFIPYFPLASGLLAGHYNENTTFADGDLRLRNPLFQEEVFVNNLGKVEALKEIAQQKGVEVVHLVLAWYLAQPGIDALIPGAKRAEQAVENLRTLEVVLSKDETKAVSRMFTV